MVGTYFVNNTLKINVFLDNVIDSTIDFENSLYRNIFYYFFLKIYISLNIVLN